MGFLTPWFLAGAAAVGLPIFVHLLQQYQQTPVKFSSLMFFEKRTQSSVKHRRLKHLLLFALRCLFILLLVLAFARPYISTSGAVSLTSAKTVVFALDNSLSMRRGGAFAKAKQQALAEIARLGDADRGQVVTFGGPAKLVTDMTGDKQTLRAAVSAIEPGDDASSYAEIARVLRSTSEGYKTNVDAHIFTDLQKSSLPASFADLRLNDGTRLNVHNVGEGFIPNWTIEAVDAPRRVFDTKKVRTLATIASWGGDMATRTVSLVANGKTVETKQVKITPGGRAVAEFLTLDVPPG
ncbi:MAG: VWA domain-containing protein [Acidobacteriia bacterium]|nr:VWA domain-containing protein [Terriglobia bacterium]